MLIDLETAYVDTRAQELSWSLGLEPLPALATLDLATPDPHTPDPATGDRTPTGRARGGLTLQLRLIGASHQVLIDSPIGRLSETVACLPDVTAPMPGRAVERVQGWAYEFHGETRHLAGPAFTAEVRRAVTLARTAAGGLVGRFPGNELAVTALIGAVRHGPGGPVAQWRTWHTYPQEGRVVVTRSRIAPARRPAGTVPGMPSRRRPTSPWSNACRSIHHPE
ncbi:DUF2617 family protein [Allostreptomyces psammosilenae]|uniref:DUF2617 family protein n=1 Tax=Allostreptomyces psammosilenae TaxID=1892865 RepID=A0A853A423_9ACTN|nr:DUF2617 family protein [Allostreptomyces psammosilenae]NYI05238.1 hypothetical protein [Allostreptomyces psammosilenae]